MKFYNITNLNVNVGDTVYHVDGLEKIKAIDDHYIYTNDNTYHYNGIEEYAHTIDDMIYFLINDLVYRIYTHEIL
jgi:hypothetical protein